MMAMRHGGYATFVCAAACLLCTDAQEAKHYSTMTEEQCSTTNDPDPLICKEEVDLYKGSPEVIGIGLGVHVRNLVSIDEKAGGFVITYDLYPSYIFPGRKFRTFKEAEESMHRPGSGGICNQAAMRTRTRMTVTSKSPSSRASRRRRTCGLRD